MLGDKVRNRTVISVMLVLLALTGCENQGASAMAPAKHKITKAMRGLWKAHNAQRGCKWTVENAAGSVSRKGSWSMKNRVQAVQLTTGDLGWYFWPNDKCGRWTKS